jgi:antitoxin component of RelBE/YafQ-DinJ toxin-antitoxin module
MAHSISVRLDDDAQRALRQLEAQGLTQSEAIRSSLVHEAARIRARQALASEVAALEADEADRAEMREVADLMEQLRAAG